MVKDLSTFDLKENTSKEYFYLNECRMRNIDLNGKENAKKFRQLNIEKETLTNWTNEWIECQLKMIEDNFMMCSFLKETLFDFSNKINNSNYIRLKEVYISIRETLSSKEKIKIIFNDEYSKYQKKHYYSGLLYLAILHQDENIEKELKKELKKMLVKEKYSLFEVSNILSKVRRLKSSL